MTGIGFDHHTAHALIELHGVFIVRIAAAGKTAEPFFPAVILQNGKGLFPDSPVLILLQHIQGMQPYPGISMPENEISDILATASDQIYRKGWI